MLLQLNDFFPTNTHTCDLSGLRRTRGATIRWELAEGNSLELLRFRQDRKPPAEGGIFCNRALDDLGDVWGGPVGVKSI